MNDRRAVILFTRDEEHEALLKPMPRPWRSDGYRRLNRHVAGVVAPLVEFGIDLVPVAGNPSGHNGLRQRGTTFGERITNAITDVMALGYDQVVVIGNDCPTIERMDVLRAFGLLSEGASHVAAPARDGGAWLVATRRGALDPHHFALLPWCTPELFEALVALPGATLLPLVRDDYDTWTDPRGRRLLRWLLPLLPLRRPVGIEPFPLRSPASIRALVRIHLPAPPPSR